MQRLASSCLCPVRRGGIFRPALPVGKVTCARRAETDMGECECMHACMRVARKCAELHYCCSAMSSSALPSDDVESFSFPAAYSAISIHKAQRGQGVKLSCAFDKTHRMEVFSNHPDCERKRLLITHSHTVAGQEAGDSAGAAVNAAGSGTTTAAGSDRNAGMEAREVAKAYRGGAH